MEARKTEFDEIESDEWEELSHMTFTERLAWVRNQGNVGRHFGPIELTGEKKRVRARKRELRHKRKLAREMVAAKALQVIKQFRRLHAEGVPLYQESREKLRAAWRTLNFLKYGRRS